jgi:dCMP deaminase
MIVIGLTGTIGAGKDTVVNYLIKNEDFQHFSVRKFLIKELQKRNLPSNRDTMRQLANELREKYGASYIIEKLYLEAIKSNKNSIIESIRTVGEVEALRNKDNFFLIAIDADPKIRYSRIKQRGSETDDVDYNTFIAQENEEMKNNDPNKQNISKCIELADYYIENNGTFQQLYDQIDRVLKEIKSRVNSKEQGQIYNRPSWDEYFIQVMNTVATRATCDRGRAGCVIVKDKRILVTGYVGAPSGLPHCDEVGHLFRKVIHEDGSITQHCVRTVHAEQNAIAQAARFGIPLDGSTLYVKMTPCRSCAMLIINSGIKRVVCEYRYHAGKESEDIFEQANIKLDFINDEILNYQNQRSDSENSQK